MKNLIKLAMMFLLFGSVLVFAQSMKVPGNAPSDVSAEIRLKLATNTAKLKDNLANFYVSGSSYQQFRSKALGTNGPAATAEGEALLVVVYNFLKNGVDNSEIISSYNGSEMGKAMIKSNGSGDAGLFATATNQPKLGVPENQSQNKGGCRWWQISCWIDDIFGAGTSGALIKALLLVIFK